VSAVAARHLARADASVATIVGCGEQGDIQLRAMAAVRPLRRAWAVDIDRNKARAYAAHLSRDLDIEVVDTHDLRAAIAGSDICVTGTTSATPILTADDAHPGLFVAAVGADNPRKQELDPHLLARTRVVVDSLDACAAGGELYHALAAGILTRDRIHAELAAIVSGRVAGRTSDEEVFVFDSTGTALFDVAAAIATYARARTADRGTPVHLGAR
jgi:ornithine cyclodeaminase/alanine dehydrogenase-like protein (mu-crystallin family)